MEVWSPQHAVDEALARRLVAERFPDFAGLAPVHVGAGWDVDVWRFGDLAVRFPRRSAGSTCLENELRVLPHIAAGVPLPVPLPLRIGEPALGYPARFYAHAYLPGVPANRARLDERARAALAATLGGFLRALHATPLPPLRAAGLVDDPRGDVARVAGRGVGWLARVADHLAPAQREVATALLVAPPAAAFVPALVHADLHAGNVLVDAGVATAVIDWGDCAAGDPAIDLAIAWSLLPAAAHGDFLAAYGPVAPDTWARARIGALSRQGLALLAWGHDRGDADVIAFSLDSIARATLAP